MAIPPVPLSDENPIWEWLKIVPPKKMDGVRSSNNFLHLKIEGFRGTDNLIHPKMDV